MKLESEPPWREWSGAGLSTSPARMEAEVFLTVLFLHKPTLAQNSLPCRLGPSTHVVRRFYLSLELQQEVLAWRCLFPLLGQPDSAEPTSLPYHAQGQTSTLKEKSRAMRLTESLHGFKHGYKSYLAL